MHSAIWLNALPITSCGLRQDDEVGVAVSLRLGLDICQPHTCFCRAAVDVEGSHALSCKHIIRHNNLNDIILRSLTRANIPATKEPNGFLRTDGKRPDFTAMARGSLFSMGCHDRKYHSKFILNSNIYKSWQLSRISCITQRS